MRLLFVGDVFGKVGRSQVKSRIADLKKKENIDFVIVNGENSSGGIGIKPEQAKELLRAGADVLTGGNHSWKHKDIQGYIGGEPRLLRPANFDETAPGKGFGVFTTPAGPMAVINLLGRVFIEHFVECPFKTADRIIKELPEDVKMIFVDFHAEATAEKVGLLRYLDGRVSAIIGTHTHVQTADDQVTAQGTAYLTDVGMTGPHGGVIGMRGDRIVKKFLNGMPTPFVPSKDDPRFQAVIIDINAETGRATTMQRLSLKG